MVSVACVCLCLLARHACVGVLVLIVIRCLASRACVLLACLSRFCWIACPACVYMLVLARRAFDLVMFVFACSSCPSMLLRVSL